MCVCVYLTNTAVSGFIAMFCTSHGANWALLSLEEQSSAVIVSEKVVHMTVSCQNQTVKVIVHSRKTTEMWFCGATN